MYRKINALSPCAAALVGVLFGWSGPTWATPVLTIDYHANAVTSTENTGVSARLTLAFSETTNGDFISILIENTTPISIGSQMTAFGLELPDHLPNPPVFAPGGSSPYFYEIDYDEPVSPGWMNAPGGYDLMITSDHNFLGGKPDGAPRAGESQTVQLALGNTPLSPLQMYAAFLDRYAQTEDHYAIARFQSVGPKGNDSDKVLGVYVPEPAALLLLSAGLAMGLRHRRRVAGPHTLTRTR